MTMGEVGRTIRPDRVAIYIRWSTDDQGEGTTLEVQREACEAFIRSQGWSFSGGLLFIDEGVSGGSLERPALTRLRSLVATGEVDCVVIYKLDRLSRSVVDMVKLVLDEWEGRCHVKSAREPIDTMTQTGRMFFYQLMSFAEWERSTIRERTFAGKLRRAQEGKNPGISAAYGYRLGPDGMPVVEPGEAAVVRLIFRLYLAGLGCGAVARRLGELGHGSPAGKAWSSGQISRVLANPIYAGRLVYGKQNVSQGQKRRSARPHLVREGAVAAIVPPAEWAAVQAARAGRAGSAETPRGGRALSSRSLLTGLLRCPSGHAYCGSGGSGPRGGYRYYYCAGAAGGTCGGGRIRQEELDRLVIQALLGQCGATPGAVAARVRAALEEDRAAAEAAVTAAGREVRRIEERLLRLQRLLLDGQLTGAEYRQMQAALEQQGDAPVNRAEQTRRQLDQVVTALAAVADSPGQVPPALGWSTLEPTEQKRLLRCFIERIEARRDGESGAVHCTITWRTASPEQGV
jgi:site-specific DNA recombinase